jgi:hypothetical protein
MRILPVLGRLAMRALRQLRQLRRQLPVLLQLLLHRGVHRQLRVLREWGLSALRRGPEQDLLQWCLVRHDLLLRDLCGRPIRDVRRRPDQALLHRRDRSVLQQQRDLLRQYLLPAGPNLLQWHLRQWL